MADLIITITCKDGEADLVASAAKNAAAYGKKRGFNRVNVYANNRTYEIYHGRARDNYKDFEVWELETR